MSQEKSLRPIESQPIITAKDVREVFCPLATDQEIAMFLGVCKSHGLDPWRREAYLIKYDAGRAATIVVGKDTFTRRAQNNPRFKGFRAGIIVLRNGKDEPVEIEGSFTLPSDKIVGGWAEAYVDGYAVPLKASVSMGEYSTGKSGWAKMPATMIRKVALVQALREAFPDELGGLYDQAEMGVELPVEKPKQEQPTIVTPKVLSSTMTTHQPQPQVIDAEQTADEIMPPPSTKADPVEKPAEKEPKDKTMDRCMSAFKRLGINFESQNAIIKAHDRDWELMIHNLNELKNELKGKSKEDTAVLIHSWVLRMTGGEK